MESKQLIGTRIKGADGKDLGEIDQLIVDSRRRRVPTGVTIGAMSWVRAITVAVALALTVAVPGVAREPDPRAHLLAATRIYRQSLDRVLPLYEKDLARASETLERQTDYFARGLIARTQVEEAAAQVVMARAKVAETKREMVHADTLIAEIDAQQRLAELRPLRRGEFDTSGGLVRYDGGRAWSLAGLPSIERFFARRFGRALPVSALGQTSVHDRMGFDHRHAVDVALHPDSREGQALIAYLRQAGVSFIAYRAAVAGAATGAHIHIGRPSERLAHLAR